jgi:hypothetical protein
MAEFEEVIADARKAAKKKQLPYRHTPQKRGIQ